jgi:hypothetical protein
MVWRAIFEQCREYLKIQDEWVNEVTLATIESYAPMDVKLTILCSAEGSRDVDAEEMQQRAERLCKTRQLEFRAVGYETNLRAPFHERYIISKDACFLLSQSIKDVGGTKSATVVSILKDKNESLIEPAFDYWATGSREKLKSKRVIRMGFEEWLTHCGKAG